MPRYFLIVCVSTDCQDSAYDTWESDVLAEIGPSKRKKTLVTAKDRKKMGRKQRRTSRSCAEPRYGTLHFTL